jgi:hypothetical protein
MIHVHSTQPFLDELETDELMSDFATMHNQRYGQSGGLSSDTTSLGQPENPFRVGQSGIATERPTRSSRQFTPTIPATLSQAMAYLILALGEVCAWDNDLSEDGPAPLTRKWNFVGLSPSIFWDSKSPSAQPSVASKVVTTPMSLGDAMRSIEDVSERYQISNARAIPGITYYAGAVTIMKDHGWCASLQNAQLLLLLGLYKAQLFRVKESALCYSAAGEILQNLLNQFLPSGPDDWAAPDSNVSKEYRKHQNLLASKENQKVLLASWTCIQLESEIVKEVDVPASDIQNLAHRLPLPLQQTEKCHNSCTRLIRCHDWNSSERLYMSLCNAAQVFLRKQLGQALRVLDSNLTAQQLPFALSILRSHEKMLEDWKEGLPSNLRWRDSDLPPSDIGCARLRATYWTVRHSITEPFMYHALHSGFSTKVKSDGVVETELSEACRRYIVSIMQSIVAFDGIPRRLIVPNIHTVAHVYVSSRPSTIFKTNLT